MDNDPDFLDILNLKVSIEHWLQVENMTRAENQLGLGM